MKSLYLLAIVALLCSGCVRVSLPSMGTVSGAIEAGTNVYDRAKIKRQGGKERELITQVSLADYDSRKEAEEFFMSDLNDKLMQYSPQREPIIVSQKIEIVEGKPNAIIQCQIIGYVFGNSGSDQKTKADARA